MDSELVCIRCVTHRHCNYQFVCLKKDHQQNRLLCAECLIPSDQGNQKKEIIDLIPLSTALSSPEKLIEWMGKDLQFSNFQSFLQFSGRDLEKEFNEQISKVDQLGQILEEIKKKQKQQLQEYKTVQKEFLKSRDLFFEVLVFVYQKINYNKFRQLTYQMQELDSQYKSDQYQQIAKELSKTIDEMLKDNSQLITKEVQSVLENTDKIMMKQEQQQIDSLQKINLQLILEQITKSLKQYEEYISSLNDILQQGILKNDMLQQGILKTSYSTDLKQKIESEEKKRLKSVDLIFKGSKDGLNGKSFWSKVNGKKNLLMVFQSKNAGNNVFGGYSPCQWTLNLNTYVKDETLKSFLFSQTQNQIYQLKQDQQNYAIHCYDSHGPTFGYNCDLQIYADFATGRSNLGNTYKFDQYNGQNNQHLFGGAQPNIGECEIYEFIFE